MKFRNNYPQNSIIGSLRAVAGIMILLLLFFFTSCKKDNTATANKAKPTVFQYISQNKQFSLYQAALKRANLYNAETFSNGGPFTVFAPVDSAFISAGLTLDSINRYDPQTLATALKYGIVNGRISSTSLVGFYAEDVTSLDTLSKPNLVKNYYGIFFNGVPIVPGGSTDLNDGVVHELQKVALPPTASLIDIIKKTPDLSLFAEAIKSLNMESKYAMLNNNSYAYFELFAPTNEAFKAFGYPDAAAIDADPTQMSYILQGCTLVFPQRIFTSTFLGGYDLNSQNFYAETDGFTLILVGNPTPIHIIHGNIVATNGVLQVVDQVIP